MTINWSPGIGDPTIMGWLIVILYFLTAILAFRVAISSSLLFSGSKLKQREFWLFITFIKLFLGLNKQLDLQSLFTAIAKYYAHRDGWYEHRRLFQVSGIIAILMVMSVLMMLFVRHMKSILRANRLAIIGLCFLVLFVMIRATSFHHMDMVINTTIFGIRMNWVLELFGIISIAVSAVSLFKEKTTIKVSVD